MKSKIDALKDKHAQQIAKLEAEMALQSSLPKTADYVSIHQDGSGHWISYKVKGLRGALEIIALFDIVEFKEGRNCFCSLAPALILNRESEKFKLSEGEYLFDVKVSDMVDSLRDGAQVEIIFWTELKDFGFLRVSCEIQGEGYLGGYPQLDARANEVRGIRGIQSRSFAGSGAGEYSVKTITWGTGDIGPVKTSYSISHLYADLASLELLIDELE